MLEYCVSGGGSCKAGLLDEIFKLQNRCARIILDALFHARTLQPFLELGWLWHQLNLYWKKTNYAIKQNPGRTRTDYLSEKLVSLKRHKSHDTRSRLPSRLIHVPMTWSECAFTIHLNCSDNDFVRSPDVKKFKRNFSDSAMCKFKPDSFKIDGIF